ncbi:hypothetical protein BCR44DRAFT_44317 [Catenaria anguillulae PL171]|uniref:RRM domain-containing protein n=1 Tax=Catenaria anguillulae PL171 TaxID=765915 RepID=A0A1Y2HG21_9FUNG|nr:hypothetical protein BCR44DRAFT_44317 [Catenaria anguillulae PL171]
MNNIRAIDKLNATELATGLAGTSASWHAQYRDSAFIYAGGFPLSLTEGDLVCIFSQYGEILHVHLARDRESGKSKGFAWIKYADQRSTDMAVDNLNGIKVLDRVVRVDHAAQFKRHEWKEGEVVSDEDRRMREIEDIVGGNVAPEIWNKSLAEMEEVVARRFGHGAPGAENNKDKDKKSKKKHKSRDDDYADDSDVSDTGLDPEDPMYKYLKEAKRELKREKREKRRAKKEAKAAAKSTRSDHSDRHSGRAHRSRSHSRSRSRSPHRRVAGRHERERDEYRSSRDTDQSQRYRHKADRDALESREYHHARRDGQRGYYERRDRERKYESHERDER